MREEELAGRRELIRFARRLDGRGILTSTDGNLSLRLSDESILITPSGSCKGMLRRDELVLAQRNGTATGRPSSELGLHRAIYEERPDVRAVIHAHPPHATAYAVAGIPLDRAILSEVVLSLGAVPVAPYAKPTGEELADSVRPFVVGHSAILLRFHGAVAFSNSVARACFMMETLEHVAQIDFLSRQMGSADVLKGADVEALREIRRAMLSI